MSNAHSVEATFITNPGRSVAAGVVPRCLADNGVIQMLHSGSGSQVEVCAVPPLEAERAEQCPLQGSEGLSLSRLATGRFRSDESEDGSLDPHPRRAGSSNRARAGFLGKLVSWFAENCLGRRFSAGNGFGRHATRVSEHTGACRCGFRDSGALPLVMGNFYW